MSLKPTPWAHPVPRAFRQASFAANLAASARERSARDAQVSRSFAVNTRSSSRPPCSRSAASSLATSTTSIPSPTIMTVPPVVYSGRHDGRGSSRKQFTLNSLDENVVPGRAGCPEESDGAHGARGRHAARDRGAHPRPQRRPRPEPPRAPRQRGRNLVPRYAHTVSETAPARRRSRGEGGARRRGDPRDRARAPQGNRLLREGVVRALAGGSGRPPERRRVRERPPGGLSVRRRLRRRGSSRGERPRGDALPRPADRALGRGDRPRAGVEGSAAPPKEMRRAPEEGPLPRGPDREDPRSRESQQAGPPPAQGGARGGQDARGAAAPRARRGPEQRRRSSRRREGAGARDGRRRDRPVGQAARDRAAAPRPPDREDRREPGAGGPP